MSNDECNFCCDENNPDNQPLVYVGYYYNNDPSTVYQGYICPTCRVFAEQETDEYEKTFVGLDVTVPD